MEKELLNKAPTGLVSRLPFIFFPFLDIEERYCDFPPFIFTQI